MPTVSFVLHIAFFYFHFFLSCFSFWFLLLLARFNSGWFLQNTPVGSKYSQHERDPNTAKNTRQKPRCDLGFSVTQTDKKMRGSGTGEFEHLQGGHARGHRLPIHYNPGAAYMITDRRQRRGETDPHRRRGAPLLQAVKTHEPAAAGQVSRPMSTKRPPRGLADRSPSRGAQDPAYCVSSTVGEQTAD